MKADPDVSLITGECTFLVTKATELFIESLAREAFLHTAQSKKKTVQKRDVDAAIENVESLMFLEGMMNFWFTLFTNLILFLRLKYWNSPRYSRNKIE